MRRLWLVGLGLVVLAAIAVVLFLAPTWRFWVIYLAARPDVPLEEFVPPAAPAYSDSSAWAALPARADAADIAPAGALPLDEAERAADVFYIHPTTMLTGDGGWNADIGNEAVNAITDSGPLANQASVFNGCCRIYAPRYRQAAFQAFLQGGEAEVQTVTLAYEDVRAAFRHYVEEFNNGRPFLLAAHSQGARYALWLLEDEIEGSALQAQFVAAYVVGYAIPEDWLEARVPQIPVCSTPSQTGCVLTWSSYLEGGSPVRSETVRHRYGDEFISNNGKALACTNPLTWTADGEAAPASLNMGGWMAGDGEEVLPVDPGLVGARCDNGALFISPRPGERYRERILPGRNYHVYDYQLFYMNIWENAIQRTEEFLLSP